MKTTVGRAHESTAGPHSAKAKLSVWGAPGRWSQVAARALRNTRRVSCKCRAPRMALRNSRKSDLRAAVDRRCASARRHRIDPVGDREDPDQRALWLFCWGACLSPTTPRIIWKQRRCSPNQFPNDTAQVTSTMGRLVSCAGPSGDRPFARSRVARRSTLGRDDAMQSGLFTHCSRAIRSRRRCVERQPVGHPNHEFPDHQTWRGAGGSRRDHEPPSLAGAKPCQLQAARSRTFGGSGLRAFEDQTRADREQRLKSTLSATRGIRPIARVCRTLRSFVANGAPAMEQRVRCAGGRCGHACAGVRTHAHAVRPR